jgi:2-polyprenyl-6-methoxyphenol hydroxylase-like FAD-dependent oxidoreductase
VVIGSGMAGLLASVVLAEAGHAVSLLERDVPPERALPRPGVPQGRQPQVLLHRALLDMEQLLPGFRDQLIAAGGVPLDTGDLAWLGARGWAPFGTPAFELVSATRPLVEHLVRARVTAHAGVRLLDGVRVSGLRRRDSAAGWLVERADGSVFTADLVVDASGRNSRLPDWLAGLGTEQVPTTTVDARFGYASRVYSGPAQLLAPVAGIVVLPTPGAPTGGTALPVEGERWLVTAVGAGDHRPPRDPMAFTAFLARLRDPALADFARTARPVGEVTIHRRTGNERHHYEHVRRWPDGLLVVGDSLCAFNPVYGQGIAVAAAQALLLKRRWAAGTRPGWEHRLLRRFARTAELPWAIASGEDLTHVAGARKTGPVDALFTRWSGEVDRLAAHGDVRAQRALDRVYHLVESPTRLFSPGLVSAVVRSRLLGLSAPSPRPPLLTDPVAPPHVPDTMPVPDRTHHTRRDSR